MRRKRLKIYLMRKSPHFLLLILMFAVSMLVGLYLPKVIPTHWDEYGVVDRLGSKYELIFALPCAAVLVYAAGAFAESRITLPSHKIRGFMSFIQFLFVVLFFVIQSRNLLRASDIWAPIERFISIPALMLYAYVAGMFGGAEYLSLFGIKTKWTMNSRAVWERTNRLAARLFYISAALMLIPIFLYELFFVFLTVPPALSFIVAAIFSKAASVGEDGGS
jgi:uncharacterized membrane protein